MLVMLLSNRAFEGSGTAVVARIDFPLDRRWTKRGDVMVISIPLPPLAPPGRILELEKPVTSAPPAAVGLIQHRWRASAGKRPYITTSTGRLATSNPVLAAQAFQSPSSPSSSLSRRLLTSGSRGPAAAGGMQHRPHGFREIRRGRWLVCRS